VRATATRLLNTQVPRETPIRSTNRQAKSKPAQSQKEGSAMPISLVLDDVPVAQVVFYI
jgi:hypothetical protein